MAQRTRTTPIDRINSRISSAREYLGAVGWTRGSHGTPGTPTDILGALQHCAEPDGYEVVAARLLASRGFDTAWNDLDCQNLFEAKQAMDERFTYMDLEAIYGRDYYGIIGIMRLLTMAESHLPALASHIGPADEPIIAAVVSRFSGSPAFEDAHIVVSRYGFNASVWMLADALVAHQLLFPDIDDELMVILAPVAEKLGL